MIISVIIFYTKQHKEEEVAVSEFSLLVQEMVKEDPSRVHVLARRCGKSCSTLLREVDPYDAGAKLGADTLLGLMEASGDVRPLIYMAHQMGMELCRKAEPAVREE